MTIIVALSLIAWAVTFTALMIGINQRSEDLIMFGIIILVGLGICCISFEMGALWQRLDTVEKYQLVKKITQ